MAFGSVHRPIYLLENAKVVVSIDADFMSLDPASVRLSGDYSRARDPDHHKMNRLYVVENDYSTTGAMADHRLAVRFGQTAAFLAALEQELDKQLSTPADVDSSLGREEKVLAAMAQDLASNRQQSVVMVGANQPAEVHARAFRINSKLENFGKTILLEQSDEPFKSGVYS